MGGVSASVEGDIVLLLPWFLNTGVSVVWDEMTLWTVRTSSCWDAIAAEERYAAAACAAAEPSSKKEGSVSWDIWLSTMVEEKEALYIW
jgi:hypothetical protein